MAFGSSPLSTPTNFQVRHWRFACEISHQNRLVGSLIINANNSHREVCCFGSRLLASSCVVPLTYARASLLPLHCYARLTSQHLPINIYNVQVDARTPLQSPTIADPARRHRETDRRMQGCSAETRSCGCLVRRMFGSAQRGVLDQLIYLTCLYDSALHVRCNLRLGCGYRQYDSSAQGTEVVDERRVVDNPNPIDVIHSMY